jgi:hypothetical protein
LKVKQRDSSTVSASILGVHSLNSQASDQSLGNLLATFRGSPIEAPTWVFIFLPGAFVISGAFVYGMYLAFTTYQQHGSALAVSRSQPWIIFAALYFIILAAYFIYRLLVSLQRIQIFQNGLGIRNFFFRNNQFLWSDIAGISSTAVKLTIFGKPISTNPSGKIFPSAGKPVDISRGYRGVPKITEIVKSKIYPQAWSQIQADIRSHDPINFGRITIDHQGMHVSGKNYNWDSIQRLHTNSGYLVVELRDNSSRKVPTIDIPNLELLLEAVDMGFN